jgi:hypothetical protein
MRTGRETPFATSPAARTDWAAAHLDDFIATREVACGLWFTGTARDNRVFRAELTRCRQTPAARWAPSSRTEATALEGPIRFAVQ